MRVLLTGATGFIGSHLARLMVRQGCQVSALVRRGAEVERVADIKGRLKLLQGDLFSPRTLKALVVKAKPELCLHLAWHTAPGDGVNSNEHFRFLKGSLDLIEALGPAGCRRLVSVGTSREYDTDQKRVSEKAAIRPRTLYAATKYAFYLAAEQLARREGWTFAWARVFSVYGPWEDDRRLVADVICSLLKGRPCALSSGEQVRDFLHVEDVARGLWAIAKSDLTGPVNIGSSKPVSVKAVARELGAILNRPDLLHFGRKEVQDYEPAEICPKTRLLRSIGWKPRYGLSEGLRQTVGWWKGRKEGR